MANKAPGVKFALFDGSRSSHPPPLLYCHLYWITPPSPDKSETGLETPWIAASGESPLQRLFVPLYWIVFGFDWELIFTTNSSSPIHPVPDETPV